MNANLEITTHVLKNNYAWNNVLHKLNVNPIFLEMCTFLSMDKISTAC